MYVCVPDIISYVRTIRLCKTHNNKNVPEIDRQTATNTKPRDFIHPIAPSPSPVLHMTPYYWRCFRDVHTYSYVLSHCIPRRTACMYVYSSLIHARPTPACAFIFANLYYKIISIISYDDTSPFPVRDIRRRRLSINEVSTYRDIALTRGHAGKGLGKAKSALRMGAVEAARLVDIMRQVPV